MRNPFRRRLPVVRDVDASVRVGDVWYDQRSAAVLERVEGRVAFRGVTAGFSRIRAMFRGSDEPQAESRAITSVPWSVGAPSVSSVTQERALRLIPVYAAVRLIADLVSTLPIKAYREDGDVRQPMNRLPQVFQQMDDDGTLLDWLHRCMTSLLLRGNAYGLITARDGMQFPTVIQWLNPDEVHCDDRNPWAPVWYWNGRVVPPEDFVHIPWFTVAGKAQGLSPIEAYAATVNVGLQAQSYASGWFDNGGVPPGTFKNTAKTVSVAESDEIKDRLVRAIQSRKPIVYGSDWDYSPISISPEQAQFVETARLTASQIAAIYGVPPDMIGGEKGGSYTYSSPEQNSLQLSTLTLRPWLVKLERKFSSMLPMRQQIKFNADAIVRADLASRMTAYQIARNIGLRNIDELRALEDLPPLPNGQGQSFAPVPQPVPQARGYNPSQPRDPGGENGGQWVKNPASAAKDAAAHLVADELDIADDIPLAAGEHLVASDVFYKRGAEYELNVAVTRKASGPEVRLGLTHEDDEWAGHPSESLIVDAGEFRRFHSEVSDAEKEGKRAAAEANNAWSGGSAPTDPRLRGETPVASGVVRGAGQGLEWNVYVTDDEPTSWQLNIADESVDGMSLNPRDSAKLLKFLQEIEAHLDTPGTGQRADPRQALLELYARESGARAGRDDMQLKNYWLHGEGAAKWSTFDELYDHLKKHVPPGKAKRIAASWFHERYGYWPGSDKNRVAHGKKPRGKRVGPG